MNILPSARVTSWMPTSSHPSLPRTLRLSWMSSITGLLSAWKWSEWICVLIRITLYSHLTNLNHASDTRIMREG